MKSNNTKIYKDLLLILDQVYLSMTTPKEFRYWESDNEDCSIPPQLLPSFSTTTSALEHIRKTLKTFLERHGA